MSCATLVRLSLNAKLHGPLLATALTRALRLVARGKDVSWRMITIDGMRMYYEEHGTPDGPPLVLLHGFTGTGDFWSNQLTAFGAHYRLLVPDLRGHGRTDNPGASQR